MGVQVVNNANTVVIGQKKCVGLIWSLEWAGFAFDRVTILLRTLQTK